MARTVEEINTQIVAALTSNFEAVGIPINSTKWSKRNMLRLLCFTFATCTAYIEQLIDSNTVYVEEKIKTSIGATALWLQSKIFEFQYSATNPQYLTMINNVPTYATINTSLMIVTACSITSPYPNSVLVKVAKSNPLESLTTEEKEALDEYVSLLGTVGIDYFVRSFSPDKILIQATIYHNKQYSTTIQANVKAAIESLFLSLSTQDLKGILKVSDIELAIKAVAGVNDVELVYVYGRGDSTLFADKVALISNKQQIERLWVTIAGYCVTETETGSTIDDTLTFIAE